MSVDPSKKRKDKRKKKAMLEALQQEEYEEERAHVQHLDEAEEDFIVYPTDDSADTAPLLEESDGSGACAKIVFLVLLSSLGLAIGVIFFEMGGMQTLNSLINVESNVDAPPMKYEPPTTPVDVSIDEDFDQIDPSPIVPESIKDSTIDVLTDSVEEVEDLPVEVIEIVTETVIIPKVVETVTETITLPEVVVQEIKEEIVELPVVEAEVVELPVVEAAAVDLPVIEPEAVEESVVHVAEADPTPAEEQPIETVTAAIQENAVSENFETQLEDEPAEVPQESFTMRAEREAVQEAVDEVWVMTVRCIEELRALQVMASSSLTHGVIDTISQRLEPLRSQLDDLVKNTSDNIFDGALEKAAELERNLRTVLGELEQARNQDIALSEEAAQKEQLSVEAVNDEEPEEVVAEVLAEEKVEPNNELVQEEVEIKEQEVESLNEPVNEAIHESVEALPEPEIEVMSEPEVNILPEPEIETTTEPILETFPEIPSHEIVESIPDSVEVVPKETVDLLESVIEIESEILPERATVSIEDLSTAEVLPETLPETPEIVKSIPDSIEVVQEETVDSLESVIEIESEILPEPQTVPVEDVNAAVLPETPEIIESIADSVEVVPEESTVVDSLVESVIETEPEILPESQSVSIEDVRAAEVFPESFPEIETMSESSGDLLTQSAMETEPEIEVIPESQVVNVEDAIAPESEIEVAAPNMAEEGSQVEAVLEPVDAEIEVKENLISEEPGIVVPSEISQEEVQADQFTVEEETIAVPENAEDSMEEQLETVEQELNEDVIAVEPELEITTPEVIMEEEAQADQPVVEVEQVVDVVFNEVAEEALPESDESMSSPLSEKPLSEADYTFISNEKEHHEIEEPVQIATETFVVEPEEVAAPVAESIEIHLSEKPLSEADYTFISNEGEKQEIEESVQIANEVVEPEEEKVTAPVAESTTDSQSRMQNLEEADRLVDQSPAQALALMEQILEKDPSNALGLYGRARSLDSLAEVERSNARLEQAVFAYRAVIDLEDQVDDQLFLKAALRCIDRMRFRGFHGKSIRIQQRLVARFPNNIEYQNQLAVGFLLTNQPEAARTIFEGVLERWPQSGFAQVHLGFILKTTFEDYDNGARWMMSGIASREEGVIDGRFYSHLGDALTRLGKHQEAQRVYSDGEKEGVFLSHQQRSLYNVDRLTGKPWWTKESTTYGPFFDLLEANWRQIHNEGVALLTLEAPEGFADESEKLRDSGNWKQFELFAQGRKNAANCIKAPVTCTLIENYPPALCKRGQVKFSIMHPGTHVWPHTGPTNCRLRAHLGLVVPGGAQLRVGNITDTWEEGKFIIFDDSFEHEVWHQGPSYRLVLIVDLWHPELTADEWKSLAPI